MPAQNEASVWLRKRGAREDGGVCLWDVFGAREPGAARRRSQRGQAPGSALGSAATKFPGKQHNLGLVIKAEKERGNLRKCLKRLGDLNSKELNECKAIPPPAPRAAAECNLISKHTITENKKEKKRIINFCFLMQIR